MQMDGRSEAQKNKRRALDPGTRRFLEIRYRNQIAGGKARDTLPVRQSPAEPASFNILGVTNISSSLLSSRTEVVLNSQLR